MHFKRGQVRAAVHKIRTDAGDAAGNVERGQLRAAAERAGANAREAVTRTLARRARVIGKLRAAGKRFRADARERRGDHDAGDAGVHQRAFGQGHQARGDGEGGQIRVRKGVSAHGGHFLHAAHLQ